MFERASDEVIDTISESIMRFRTPHFVHLMAVRASKVGENATFLELRLHGQSHTDLQRGERKPWTTRLLLPGVLGCPIWELHVDGPSRAMVYAWDLAGNAKELRHRWHKMKELGLETGIDFRPLEERPRRRKDQPLRRLEGVMRDLEREQQLALAQGEARRAAGTYPAVLS